MEYDGLTFSDETKLNEGADNNEQSAPFSQTYWFDKMFPFYLSIGMTAEQYWHGDCTLVKAYREADKLKKERENQKMWLQGLYVYDAILRLSPVLGMNPRTPEPYPDQPYSLNGEEEANERQTDKEEVKMHNAQAHFAAYVSELNKQRTKKGGDDNG